MSADALGHLFKGDNLDGYIEAARVVPLAPDPLPTTTKARHFTIVRRCPNYCTYGSYGGGGWNMEKFGPDEGWVFCPLCSARFVEFQRPFDFYRGAPDDPALEAWHIEAKRRFTEKRKKARLPQPETPKGA